MALLLFLNFLNRKKFTSIKKYFYSVEKISDKRRFPFDDCLSILFEYCYYKKLFFKFDVRLIKKSLTWRLATKIEEILR